MARKTPARINNQAVDNKHNSPGILLSTAYFAPIYYYLMVVQHDYCVIDLLESYPKQTWRNRCTIMGGNGLQNLSIPIEKPSGNNTPTGRVLLSNHTNWRRNHWRSIACSYNNAPYFLYYKDMVESVIFDFNTTLLCEFNHSIFTTILKELGISKNIEFLPEFIKQPCPDLYTDMRSQINPKNKKLNLYTSKLFRPYFQVFQDRYSFQPNLSILDPIFNLGPETAKYLHKAASEHTNMSWPI